MPDVEVDYVIADYLTPEFAKAAVESLERSGLDYTATVIDAYNEGLSFSRAIHRGVAAGSAPIICALNADVECKGSQRPVLDLFEEFPDVAVVGPLQVNRTGIVVHGGILGRNEVPIHRYFNEPLVWHEPELRTRFEDAVTASGSVYYARRDVWEELGGFLDTPHYYEETWFSYLCRHRGYRVLYTGAVEWLHHWDSSPLTHEQKGAWFKESQAMFREACAAEGIACD